MSLQLIVIFPYLQLSNVQGVKQITQMSLHYHHVYKPTVIFFVKSVIYAIIIQTIQTCL